MHSHFSRKLSSAAEDGFEVVRYCSAEALRQLNIGWSGAVDQRQWRRTGVSALHAFFLDLALGYFVS
jgi:hypothetical protein